MCGQIRYPNPPSSTTTDCTEHITMQHLQSLQQMLHFLFIAKLIYLCLWLAKNQLKIKFLVLWKYQMPQEHAVHSFVWQLVISNNAFILALYLSPAKRSLPCICVASRLVTHALHWTSPLRQQLTSVALVRKCGLFICTLVSPKNKRDVTGNEGTAIQCPLTSYTIYNAVLAVVILIEHILK